MTTGTDPITYDSTELLIKAVREWATGLQSAAVETLRPLAEQDDRSALVLISWFLHQLGDRWREGVPHAERAVQLGLYNVANYYWGNMLGDPQFHSRAARMCSAAIVAGSPLDPVGNLPQLVQSGNIDAAAEVVRALATPRPALLGENGAAFLEQLANAAARSSAARVEIEAHLGDVRDLHSQVVTQTGSLKNLIAQATNAQARDFFEAEAQKYDRESRVLWRWAVGIMTCAALLSVAPLLLDYFNIDTLGKDQSLWAHFAPAVALGSVAGVLLARSRGRDRSRQKAKDLSIALSTMLAYSSLIADEAERQRFVHDMGRVVIEAFLHQESPSGDGDGISLLEALARRG